MKIDIFNKTIMTKDYHCQKNLCNDLWHVKDPYVNIYVKVTEKCQAKCKFCEFCSQENTEFDLHKFYYVMSELQKKIIINKISFTGGELSLDIDNFKSILIKTKEVSPKSFIVANTNGYNISELMDMDEIDSVALSRHHYNERKNSEIFGINSFINIPTNNELNNLHNKHKIHFSCNLVKGYIDSYEEMCKYLEWSASVGVRDVGFVTLMKVNDYCTDNHIDFRDIDLSNKENILHYQTWNNKGSCECRNYVFNPKDGDSLVKIYARYNSDFAKGNESNLVFDGSYLRTGFGGEIII
jgi:MoaA/NifB/PqqE/SkfB family radical SAM enzyme